MSVLNGETVQFIAGYNAAAQGRELRPGASDEAEAGYNAYYLSLSPPIPKICSSRGYASKKGKANIRAITERTFARSQDK